MTKHPIFTIGHSNHSLEDFLALLSRHRIGAVADVRSVPWSRFNPQFNRNALKDALGRRGVHYVYLGRELGGRPQDPACYEDGRVRYALVARTAGFRDGIARVTGGAEEHRIALMCAEREPLRCHRTLLVARALDEGGVEVVHILAGGSVEAHAETMARLTASIDRKPDIDDLFPDELADQTKANQSGGVAGAVPHPASERE